MRLIAASILAVAVVIAVVGWRATQHPTHRNPHTYIYGKP